MHLLNCLQKVNLANVVHDGRKLLSSVSACVIVTYMKIVKFLPIFVSFCVLGDLLKKLWMIYNETFMTGSCLDK